MPCCYHVRSQSPSKAPPTAYVGLSIPTSVAHVVTRNSAAQVCEVVGGL